MLTHKTKLAVFGASFLGLSAGVLTLSGCSFPGKDGNDANVPQGNPGGGFSFEEGIAACSGKSAGDTCEFSPKDKDVKISGSCTQMKDDSALSCMPERPADGSGNGPGNGPGSGPRNGSGNGANAN